MEAAKAPVWAAPSAVCQTRVLMCGTVSIAVATGWVSRTGAIILPVREKPLKGLGQAAKPKNRNIARLKPATPRKTFLILLSPSLFFLVCLFRLQGDMDCSRLHSFRDMGNTPETEGGSIFRRKMFFQKPKF
jgi:hypothetical protein